MHLQKRITLLAGLVLLGVTASADETLPLPRDVSRMQGPLDAMMGQQPVTIYAFHTKLTKEEVRAFYLEALPKTGWSIKALPWMAQFEGQWAQFKKLQEQHPELRKQAQDPSIEQQIKESKMAEMREYAGHMLYAERKEERLLLNLTVDAAGITGVFVNRWKGDFMDMNGKGAPPASNWPQQNTCCTSEQVPATARKLPLSIPDYPNAVMVNAGTFAESGMSTAVYTSNDDRQKIVAFYRQQMGFNGWTMVGDPMEWDKSAEPSMAKIAHEVKATQMSFRGQQGLCSVAVTEGTPAAGTPGVPPSGLGGVKALVMITFIEQRNVSRPRSFDGMAPHAIK